MQTIPLTKGQVAIVSDERFGELSQWSWYAGYSEKSGNWYAYRRKILAGGRRKIVAMHREILGLDPDDPRQGDHINGNSLDNRNDNLRIATREENAANRGKPKTNTSGHKGVHWNLRKQRWQVLICFEGVRRHLGYFVDLEEAAAAYNRAAVETLGEFVHSSVVGD